MVALGLEVVLAEASGEGLELWLGEDSAGDNEAGTIVTLGQVTMPLQFLLHPCAGVKETPTSTRAGVNSALKVLQACDNVQKGR